jgi:glycosyltransferase involved in cell wall biosynthesis
MRDASECGRVAPERQLRVAVLLYSAKATGARRQKIRLASAFARRGCAVELVLVRARGALLASVAPEVRLVVLEGAALRWAVALRLGSAGTMAAALPSLVGYLRRSAPDVLLAGNTPASLLAAPAHRLAQRGRQPLARRGRQPLARRGRLVACVTNHVSGSRIPGAAAERWLVRRTLPWADAVVAVGEAVARDVREQVPAVGPRLRTIHNPVIGDDLAERRAAAPPHPWFEDGGPAVVLGCGRLEPQKDFATLLRAFALVRREREIRLVILGEGPERRALAELAAALGVARDVAFLGWVDDPFPAMARAGLLVLSSRWEGMPNVLIEAMACGCPVVSTDAPGGSRDALAGGALGPLVPPGDARAMARAMLAVLGNPPPRAALEARAAGFTEARSVEAYLALFRSLP